MSFCTSWLEKNGLLEISGRGGRGLANTYRIIPDAEAVTPAAATTAAENGADDGTVSNQHGAENGAVFGQNGADFGQNSAKNGTPTESEQEERTKPPSGESRASAREGGEDFSNAGVDRSQVEMLPPTDGGGGERMVRERAKFKSYNPAAWVVDDAAKLGVNALDRMSSADSWPGTSKTARCLPTPIRPTTTGSPTRVFPSGAAMRPNPKSTPRSMTHSAK